MQTDPPTTIGVCGIGQMGAAAAVCFRRAGYRVLLWARNPAKLIAVESAIESMDSWLNKHIGPPAAATGSLELEPVLDELDAEADVVMDCVGEDMDQKVALFKRFVRAQYRGVIFITTTSGLSITEMGRLSGCGDRLVGTHFWNPPHLMPVVEVIRGEDTLAPIVDQVCLLVESLGKQAVRVKRDVPGFIGNRLLHALWREAVNLVERDIASAEDVDTVAKMTFGLRMPVVGPLENMDLVGLDLIEKIHNYLLADLSADQEAAKLLADNVANGRLGMKSGSGFYDWTQSDPDDLINRRDKQIVSQLNYLKKNHIQ